MKQPHQINAWYSILLIVMGLWGLFARYSEIGDWQLTALIPAFFGVALLLMTPGIKKENAIISHIVVLLTAVLVIMVAVLLTKGLISDPVWARKQWIFLLVLFGGIISFKSQWQYFMAQRKRKALKNS